MSNFAFGTYRISDLNPEHIEALKEAIKSGITMIDTSSNYMDGGSERAIALSFRNIDPSYRDEVEIVSKFGYLQGTNLQDYKKGLLKIEDPQEVVKYSEDCYHSISKDFLHQQLSRSLDRLEIKKIGCYLVDNPQYYILDAIKRGVSKDERLDKMYEKLQNTFIGFEEEIKKGRIGSYGVSSESFSLSESSEEFLPYEDLLTLAQNAADIVGNVKHGFTTIELPINILEREGFKCASWAKKNSLRVLTTRALSARYNGKKIRLCDYDESREYYYYFNELMEICDNETLRSMYNLLDQLDIRKHKFEWIGDYDLFLISQILPHMKRALESVDKSEIESILNYIDPYLKEYRKMVAYECSKKTREELGEVFKECESVMQECALRFLMHRENIDYIIVGMRKISHVDQILSLE
jgi:aryl-alcohol dehydrogenase-like predicted oxidoreductase